MMRANTTSPTTALHHVDAGPGPTPTSDRPQYQHVGGGRFLPVNEAAREECRRWNQYADLVNARTARSIAP
jgi:hypothetical protein